MRIPQFVSACFVRSRCCSRWLAASFPSSCPLSSWREAGLPRPVVALHPAGRYQPESASCYPDALPGDSRVR